MHAKTSVYPVYIRSNEILRKKLDSKAFRICYISPADQKHTFDFAHPALHFSCYNSVKKQLAELSEMNQLLPDVIIINIPYSLGELKRFTEWICSDESLRGIPVIYSKSILSVEEVRELRAEKIVDDIIDFNSNIDLLPTKCFFLQRVKEYQSCEPEKPKSGPAETLAPPDLKVDAFLRRSVDIILSLCLILFLLPVFILVGLIICLESKGPVIYTSYRAGRGYKIFKFYKFRTMHVNADHKVKELEKLNLYSDQKGSAKFFKIKNDPRITKLGAFLRNTSLDELPQLFNVLKGDMSIVGNRPLPLYEASTLTTNEWAQRFMAPAGITGLWQIMKRGKDDMSSEERINIDINYAKDNGIIKDLWIIAKTPTALFQKTNV